MSCTCNHCNRVSYSKISPSMKKHLKALKIRSVNAYLKWCNDQDFRNDLNKTSQEREQELHRFLQLNSESKRKLRLNSDPATFLNHTCLGTLSEQDLPRNTWRHVYDSISSKKLNSRDRKSLAEFLVGLQKKVKFIFETLDIGDQTYSYIEGLIFLHTYRNLWKRSPKTWRPKSRNTHKQFLELTEYLFSDFRLPAFLCTAWFRQDAISKRYRSWYLLLGNGRNIREAALTVPLTKKMAHHFLQAPADITIEEALLYARVRGLGGNEPLAHAFIGSKLRHKTQNLTFWNTVIQFFVNHPTFECKHVAPVVDFIHAQKFKVRERVTRSGQVEQVLPPHPNFTMKKRTPASLIQQVKRWHDELAKERLTENRFFKRSGINGFQTITTTKKTELLWSIDEILSGRDLIEEGRLMRHCVAIYAYECIHSQSSIWTLTSLEQDNFVKHLTIEIEEGRKLVQARGKFNRRPTKPEFEILKKWATAERLKIAKYVKWE